MKSYRIKKGCGSHREEGRTYKAGDVITCEHNLAKMFPFKFEEVSLVPGAPAGSAVVVPPSVSVPNPAAAAALTTAAPDASTLGRDVSDKFPKAVEQSFKVFAGQGGLHVYDEDDLNLGNFKPLNKEPLTKKAVNAFVENFLKSGA